MTCTRPKIRAETWQTYTNQKGGKSYKCEWLSRQEYDKGHYKGMTPTIYRRIDLVPCGKCLNCRLSYAKEKAILCMLEKKYYPDNECWFLTLTYADEHLPSHKTIDLESGEIFEGISVDKKDLQLFWKRCRKKYKNSKIRYLNVAEYGKKSYRPHNHAIVFGLPLDETKFKKLGNNMNGDPYYTSKELEDLWGLGNVVIGRVTYQSVGYTAKYCLKKTKEQYDLWWYQSQGKCPEFISMSQSLGKRYFDEHWQEIYEHDCVPVKDKTGNFVKPPRIFDRYLSEKDYWYYLKIKRQRKQKQMLAEETIDKQTDNSREERRRISERRIEKVMKDLRGESCNGL